jgi:hypothetical protein
MEQLPSGELELQPRHIRVFFNQYGQLGYIACVSGHVKRRVSYISVLVRLDGNGAVLGSGGAGINNPGIKATTSSGMFAYDITLTGNIEPPPGTTMQNIGQPVTITTNVQYCAIDGANDCFPGVTKSYVNTLNYSP